jgi:hypothetical protein
MTGFVFDIKAFENAALLEMNKALCRDAEELFSEVVVESPDPPGVGGFAKGLLKNSWYIDAAGDTDNTVGTTPNTTGADSLSRIKAVLTTLPFYGRDGAVSLTNSLEYAYRAEAIGWPAGEGTNGFVWSGRVGPYAMVQTAITNFKAKHL